MENEARFHPRAGSAAATPDACKLKSSGATKIGGLATTTEAFHAARRKSAKQGAPRLARATAKSASRTLARGQIKALVGQDGQAAGLGRGSEQARRLGKLLQRGFRPGAVVTDHLGGGETAQAPADL
jgi:hypothetical protein